LAVIAETPRRIRELLDEIDPETMVRRPADGGWSAAEIIGHLLDDEIINAFRLRLTLTAEQPLYPGTDPERWADLAKPPLEQVWSAWEALRANHLWLLRSLPRADWQRAGLHTEQSLESVEVQILKNAGHDLAHIEQLKRWLVAELNDIS
jgi:hypothetical protein